MNCPKASESPRPELPNSQSTVRSSRIGKMSETIPPHPYKQAGIVGTGAMGRGIAQLLAQSGVPVRLFDANPGAVASAIAQIGDVFAKLAEKGRMSAEA